jgi:hypothetical protein
MEGLLSEFAAPSLTRKTHLPRRDIFVYPSQRQAHGTSVDIENSTSRDSREGTLALVTWLNGPQRHPAALVPDANLQDSVPCIRQA